MRQRYFVTYDVCDPKRLRKVFETLKGFGDHVQLSVFRCDLSRMELAQLKGRLMEWIHVKEDQVLFIDLGPVDGRGDDVVESLGRAYVRPEAGAVVV